MDVYGLMTPATGAGADEPEGTALALALIEEYLGAIGLYRSRIAIFSLALETGCSCCCCDWPPMRSGCNATDDMALFDGRFVLVAESVFGMDPDPDIYGLLERDLWASILAFAAATRSCIAPSMRGLGGKEAGPAVRDSPVVPDEDDAMLALALVEEVGALFDEL